MKRNRNNKIWTVLSKVISKIVNFAMSWPIGGAVPTLTNILSSKIIICWLTVQKLYLKMCIFGISRPIGGAVPNFGIYSQVIVSMKRTKLCVDWSNFGRDTASETIVGRRRRPSQHHNFFFSTRRPKRSVQSFLCSSVWRSSEPSLGRIDRFEGGVAKTLFFICFKMADRHHVGKWQMRHRQNRHNPGNEIT